MILLFCLWYFNELAKYKYLYISMVHCNVQKAIIPTRESLSGARVATENIPNKAEWNRYGEIAICLIRPWERVTCQICSFNWVQIPLQGIRVRTESLFWASPDQIVLKYVKYDKQENLLCVKPSFKQTK